MGGPYFSNSDYEEYDAGEMTLKQLEYQTADHEKDCDCHYCYARNRRRDAEQGVQADKQ